MDIAGFVKTSLIDYPGKIASVVFTHGCNLRCGYCHNYQLLDGCSIGCLKFREIFDWFSRRRHVIDGVVVSGGEPTLQEDLEFFIRELKLLGFLVKLDTNGTNPQVLSRLLSRGLLDFVAMDLKAPIKKYAAVTRTGNLDVNRIRKSAQMIRISGVSYEFRTTLCPGLTPADIERIITDFEVSPSNYVVQNCRSTDFMTTSQIDNRRKYYELRALGGLCSFRGFRNLDRLPVEC